MQPEWLTTAIELFPADEMGAMTLIHLETDELFQDSKFAECDAILADLDLTLHDEILLSFVVATYPAMKYLPNRQRVYDGLSQRYKAEGRNPEEILVGLNMPMRKPSRS